MRIRILLTLAVILMMVPSNTGAMDQGTLENMKFLLVQPEWNKWGDESVFPAPMLLEGLNQIYNEASGKDDVLAQQALWAMGETGMVEFQNTLILAVQKYPQTAAYALGKIPSESGVYALLGLLKDSDPQTRDAAVVSLGMVPWISSMEDAKEYAITALKQFKSTETELWIVEDIDAAVIKIETGTAVTSTFEEPIEHGN